MPEELLSPHFSKAEMDCPCCGECFVKAELLLALEQLRSIAGDAPVGVTSACRCRKRNAAVGGTKTS